MHDGWSYRWMELSVHGAIDGWSCRWMELSVHRAIDGWSCRWMKHDFNFYANLNRWNCINTQIFQNKVLSLIENPPKIRKMNSEMQFYLKKRSGHTLYEWSKYFCSAFHTPICGHILFSFSEKVNHRLTDALIRHALLELFVKR